MASAPRRVVPAALCVALCVSGPAAVAPAAGEAYGLFPAERFLAVEAGRADGLAPAAALHLFADEWIAVPAPGLAATGRPPAETSAAADGLPLPPLAWLAAPELHEGARLLGPDRLELADGTVLPFAAVEPLPDNELYVDGSTWAFFAARPLRVRGTTVEDGSGEEGGRRFVARTVWPEDARIPWRSLEPESVVPPESLADLVRAQVPSWPAARLLWERDRPGPRDWAGRPVLAVVLSGAQADAPGSQAGHIAVATGRLGPDGEWADWLANNVYPIETVGEKGIVSGPVPMDNYLTDLNSGQAMYRPIHVLVAVLASEEPAAAVQEAFQELFLRYWCRDVRFHRARHNSTEMSVDRLREAGWQVPRVGGTSRLTGALAAVVVAVATLRPGLARDAWSYFTEERTDFLPRVAFETAAEDLLTLVAGEPGRILTPLETTLREDTDAILFLRFPQIPSSRPFGTYAVDSIRGYRARVALREATGIDPKGPEERPFPDPLREACSSLP